MSTIWKDHLLKISEKLHLMYHLYNISIQILIWMCFEFWTHVLRSSQSNYVYEYTRLVKSKQKKRSENSFSGNPNHYGIFINVFLDLIISTEIQVQNDIHARDSDYCITHFITFPRKFEYYKYNYVYYEWEPS